MVRRDDGFHALLVPEDVGRRVMRIRGLNHEWYSPDLDCIIKSVNAQGTRAMVGRTTHAPEAYSIHHSNLQLWSQ